MNDYKISEIDDLMLCRLIMRMYLVCELNAMRQLVPSSGNSDLWGKFLSIKDELFNVFRQKEISIHESATISQFDERVMMMPQVSFIDMSIKCPVPQSVLERFSGFLNTTKLSCQIVRFGLLGRTLANNKRYISDGLQSSEECLIKLDYSVHSISTHDELLYRVTHELLHVYDITEDQIPEYILRTILYLRGHMDQFISELQLSIQAKYTDFKNRCRSVCIENPYLLNTMALLAHELQRRGIFPFEPRYCTATVTYIGNEYKLICGVKCDGIETLFM